MRKRKGWKLQMAVAGALSLVAATALAGQVTLYERPAFQGQSATTTVALPNLARSYFNDGASSIVVGDGTWEACTEPYFRGRCAQLVPGSYSRLSGELNSLVASVRQIDYQPASTRVVVVPDVTTVVVKPANGAGGDQSGTGDGPGQSGAATGDRHRTGRRLLSQFRRGPASPSISTTDT